MELGSTGEAIEFFSDCFSGFFHGSLANLLQLAYDTVVVNCIADTDYDTANN